MLLREKKINRVITKSKKKNKILSSVPTVEKDKSVKIPKPQLENN